MSADQVRMEIKGLMLDPTSNVPIVILKDAESSLFLPIWIGVFEANAIALKIEGVEMPRPMTHDLFRTSIEQLGGRLEKILISDLKDNTFFAQLHLRQDDRQLTVDSRPSDAIALAVRTEAPIFVLREVLDRAKAADLTATETDEEKLKKWLEEVSPEDLGKYKM